MNDLNLCQFIGRLGRDPEIRFSGDGKAVANLSIACGSSRGRGCRMTPEEVAAYRRNNPEKYRAHQVVARAIRAGTLKRDPCERCGNKRAHAHHDDYSKPLEVRWLCAMHHKHHHQQKEAT